MRSVITTTLIYLSGTVHAMFFFPKLDAISQAPVQWYRDNSQAIETHISILVPLNDLSQRIVRGACSLLYSIAVSSGGEFDNACIPGPNFKEVGMPKEEELQPLAPPFIKFISQPNIKYHPAFNDKDLYDELLSRAVHLSYAWSRKLKNDPGNNTTSSPTTSSTTTSSTAPINISPSQISSLVDRLHKAISKAPKRHPATRRPSPSISHLLTASSPRPTPTRSRDSLNSAEEFWATRYSGYISSILNYSEPTSASSGESFSGSSTVVGIATITPLVEGDEIYTVTTYARVKASTASSSSSRSVPTSTSSSALAVPTAGVVDAGWNVVLFGGLWGVVAVF